MTEQSIQQMQLLPSLPETIDTRKVEIYKANYAVKIKDFTDANQYADLVKVISEWRFYLGIKDEMTTQELELNAKFIKDEYPNYTLEKIKLAIKYSLKGELKCDIKPYGAFSPLYIATILNAYEKYDQKVVSDVLREKDRKEQERNNKPVELSPEQVVQSRREYLQYFIDNINRTDVTPFKDYNGVMWNFLIQNGEIKHEVLDRYDLKEKAHKSLTIQKNPFEMHQTSENEFEDTLKRFAMQEFFQMNEIKLNEYTDIQIML